MYQIVETTHDEKTKMYMKCTKVELAKMLIECNRILEAQFQVKNIDNAENSNNTVVVDSFIISFYKKHEQSYIFSTEEGIFKTRYRSKAKIFTSKKEAKKYIKDNGYQWRKGYEVEKL